MPLARWLQAARGGARGRRPLARARARSRSAGAYTAALMDALQSPRRARAARGAHGDGVRSVTCSCCRWWASAGRQRARPPARAAGAWCRRSRACATSTACSPRRSGWGCGRPADVARDPRLRDEIDAYAAACAQLCGAERAARARRRDGPRRRAHARSWRHHVDRALQAREDGRENRPMNAEQSPHHPRRLPTDTRLADALPGGGARDGAALPRQAGDHPADARLGVAGEHMVLVGPPGTAKCAMVGMFAQADRRALLRVPADALHRAERAVRPGRHPRLPRGHATRAAPRTCCPRPRSSSSTRSSSRTRRS